MASDRHRHGLRARPDLLEFFMVAAAVGMVACLLAALIGGHWLTPEAPRPTACTMGATPCR